MGNERVQFHVRVRTRADHPGFATLEIIDKLTGRTQIALPPEVILDPALVP